MSRRQTNSSRSISIDAFVGIQRQLKRDHTANIGSLTCSVVNVLNSSGWTVTIIENGLVIRKWAHVDNWITAVDRVLAFVAARYSIGVVSSSAPGKRKIESVNDGQGGVPMRALRSDCLNQLGGLKKVPFGHFEGYAELVNNLQSEQCLARLDERAIAIFKASFFSLSKNEQHAILMLSEAPYAPLFLSFLNGAVAGDRIGAAESRKAASDLGFEGQEKKESSPQGLASQERDIDLRLLERRFSILCQKVRNTAVSPLLDWKICDLVVAVGNQNSSDRVGHLFSRTLRSLTSISFEKLRIQCENDLTFLSEVISAAELAFQMILFGKARPRPTSQVSFKVDKGQIPATTAPRPQSPKIAGSKPASRPPTSEQHRPPRARYYFVTQTLRGLDLREVGETTLWDWVNESDVQLPESFLDVSISEVVTLGFDEVVARQGIGGGKIEKLISLLERVRESLKDSKCESNGNHVEPPEPECPVRMEAEQPNSMSRYTKHSVAIPHLDWSLTQRLFDAHGILDAPLGQYSRALAGIPARFWKSSLSSLVDQGRSNRLDMWGNNIEAAKVVDAIRDLVTLLGEFPQDPYFTVTLTPRRICQASRWVVSNLKATELPDESSMQKGLFEPLFFQFGDDLGETDARIVRERYGRPWHLESFEGIAKGLSVSTQTLRQVLARCSHVMSVRWPDGRYILDDLLEHFASTSDGKPLLELLEPAVHDWFGICHRTPIRGEARTPGSGQELPLLSRENIDSVEDNSSFADSFDFVDPEEWSWQ